MIIDIVILTLVYDNLVLGTWAMTHACTAVTWATVLFFKKYYVIANTTINSMY